MKGAHNGITAWVKAKGYNQTLLRKTYSGYGALKPLTDKLVADAQKEGKSFSRPAVASALAHLRNKPSRLHKNGFSKAVLAKVGRVKLPPPTLELDVETALDDLLTAMANMQKAALALDAKYQRIRAALSEV